MGIIESILGTPFAIILFSVGFLLIFIEMFQPGFGIIGGIGIVCLIIGIILTADSILQAVIMGLIMIVVIAAMVLIFLKLIKRGKFRNTIMLSSSTDSESGFLATDDYSSLIGLEGKTHSMLRPAGIAIFNGRKLDVVSNGDFIPADTAVKIVEVEGNRIVVNVIDS